MLVVSRRTGRRNSVKQIGSNKLDLWRNGRRIVLAASVTLALAFAIVVAQSAMMPRDVAAIDVNGPAIPQGGTVSAGPAVVRSWADMERDGDLTPAVNIPAGATINAPTIPLSEYNSLKAWSAPATASRPGAAPSLPSTPVIKGVNFAGATQGESGRTGFFPSDSHVAAGSTQLVETTNSSIDVWSKVISGTPTLLKSVSQNTFTGNATDSLGDSRVIWDAVFKRWIITIDDFSGLTNGSKPSYIIAVSLTPYAAPVTGITNSGVFFISSVFISTSPSGLFYDYPQLGQDQDAVLLSANMFTPSAFFGPMVHSIAKAKLYNGIGFSFGVFFAAASAGTLAPPNVFNSDQAANDYFLSAPVGSGKTAIQKFTMTNSSRKPVTFSGPINITVPSYTTPPPSIPQPAPCNVAADRLDSLDGRFQNATYQFGALSFQTHATNFVGFATPTWYQVNNSTNTLVQSGKYFKSSSSSDWSPAISGNGTDLFVTWNATDTSVNPMVLFGGRIAATSTGVMNVQSTPAFTSPVCLSGNFDSNFGLQRWGDYSAVSMDPTYGSTAWVIDQDVVTSSIWGTRLVRIGN